MRRRWSSLSVSASVLAPVAALAICSGCARKQLPAPSARFVPPAAKLASVESAHIFADEARDLTLGRLPGDAVEPFVPAPLRISDIEAPGVLLPPDIAHIREGLAGRLDAALGRYAAGVKQRELRSAEIASRQERELRQGELDAHLEKLAAGFARQTLEARGKASAERAKLQFDSAVLRAQLGAAPGKPEDLAQRIARMEARLAEIEKATEDEAGRLRAQHAEDTLAAKSAFETEMSRLEGQARADALERAAQQEYAKGAVLRGSVESFVSNLADGGLAMPPPARRLGPAPGAPGGARAREAQIRGQFARAGARIGSRIRQDAQIASSLGRKSQPCGSSPGGEGPVTEAAAGLVGGAPR